MGDQPRSQTGRNEAAPEDAGDRRGELVSVLCELYASGLITATGGNLSVRVPATEEIWITPAGDHKGGLRADQLVRMRIDSQQPEPTARRASSEWRMHCAVYQARAEVEAVIHAHAPQATILALNGLPFLPGEAIAFLRDRRKSMG